jgi:hypothetical protein
VGPRRQESPTPHAKVIRCHDRIQPNLRCAAEEVQGLGIGEAFSPGALNMVGEDLCDGFLGFAAGQAENKPRLEREQGMSIIHHDAEPTSRSKDPHDLIGSTSRVWRMVNNPPRIDEIKCPIGEWQILGISYSQIRSKTLSFKTTLSHLDCGRC